ncbi:carbohydrate binding family 9 domain-containing protein [Biformimicrobium ophioploci]|uniref:DUF5916 domain-containing protein n=1 Tax=Biformimicrobium ophioploci TaxID=3036711 RepID=A0ABQ6LWK8_9GAMM|nr:carbohydrate binding family 9 domain-containing protein [Microbulbifer sp. NKW57]GMG86499.1 DUF5916 domain-containing protein [Microbulbifer sp. NKW57]
MHLKTISLMALLVLSAASSTWATQPIRMTGLFAALPHEQQVEITLDGKLDEPHWQRAELMDLPFEIFPGENTPADRATEAYLFYSHDALYVGIRASDPEPQRLRASYRQRDEIDNQDQIRIHLDSFNEQRSAYQLRVNAIGIQADEIISSSGLEDPDWNGIWYSEGRITEQGYEVEVKIPFTTLGFDNSKQAQQWGVFITRFTGYGDFAVYGSSPWEQTGQCEECDYPKLELHEPINASSGYRVTPYVVAGRSRTRDLAQGGDWSDKTDTDAGVDLVWKLGSDSAVTVTANPDFSQVDADTIQFDLNERFALQYPEKRAFFLEDQRYFNSFFPVLYTRNINAPDWGLKYTGRFGDHTLGSFVVDDYTTSFILPGRDSSELVEYAAASTNGVLSYRNNVSDKLRFGSLSTLRKADDYHSAATGFNVLYRPWEGHTFAAEVYHSDTQNPELLQQEYGLQGTQKGHAAHLYHSYQTRELSFTNRVRNIADGFRADLGVLNQVGVWDSVSETEYRIYADRDTWWNRVEFELEYERVDDLDFNRLSDEAQLKVAVDAVKQRELGMFAETGHELYEGVEYALNGSGVWGGGKVLDSLHINSFMGRFERINYDNPLSGTGTYSTGDVEIDWSPGAHWEVAAMIDLGRFEVDGGELYRTRLVQARVRYNFSAHQQLQLWAQRAETEQNPALYVDAVEAHSRQLLTQLRYRYQFNAYSSLVAGITSVAGTRPASRALVSEQEGVFVKLSYAFE